MYYGLAHDLSQIIKKKVDQTFIIALFKYFVKQ